MNHKTRPVAYAREGVGENSASKSSLHGKNVIAYITDSAIKQWHAQLRACIWRGHTFTNGVVTEVCTILSSQYGRILNGNVNICKTFTVRLVMSRCFMCNNFKTLTSKFPMYLCMSIGFGYFVVFRVCLLIVVVWLSEPVQVIDWKDWSATRHSRLTARKTNGLKPRVPFLDHEVWPRSAFVNLL